MNKKQAKKRVIFDKIAKKEWLPEGSHGIMWKKDYPCAGQTF